MKLTLGAFIALLRKEKGMTQRQLAEMLSVSDKTVSHWEREESSPDISLLPVIAEIFEITVDELLRGERKAVFSPAEEKPEQKESNYSAALLYSLESSFNKFRTRNLISVALSVIAVLCGFIVNYYITVEFSYLVFLALLVVPLLLTSIFRGNFSSQLSSPYIEQDAAKDYTFKSNRVTANSFYFSFSCFAVYSVTFMRFYVPYISVLLLCLIFAAAMIFLCEVLLRKHGILKKSGKSLALKKIFVLKAICIFTAVIMLYCGYVSHMSINREQMIYENAEYTLITDVMEFISFMETEKEAPDEIYHSGNVEFSFYDKGTEVTFYYEFGMDSSLITVLDPEYDKYIEFTYNNLEVADFHQIEEGFVIYTHSNLIAADEKADKQINILVIMHLAYYFAVPIFILALYFILKRKIILRAKKDKITLIKDF